MSSFGVLTVMIKRCPACGYTLEDTCKKCGLKTKGVHPPRFSITDKYVKYRIIAGKK